MHSVGDKDTDDFDPILVRECIRPVVWEEMRLSVDQEMRILLENLEEMVEAEKLARNPKAKKKKPKKKKKEAQEAQMEEKKGSKGSLRRSERGGYIQRASEQRDHSST